MTCAMKREAWTWYLPNHLVPAKFLCSRCEPCTNFDSALITKRSEHEASACKNLQNVCVGLNQIKGTNLLYKIMTAGNKHLSLYISLKC